MLSTVPPSGHSSVIPRSSSDIASFYHDFYPKSCSLEQLTILNSQSLLFHCPSPPSPSYSASRKLPQIGQLHRLTVASSTSLQFKSCLPTTSLQGFSFLFWLLIIYQPIFQELSSYDFPHHGSQLPSTTAYPSRHPGVIFLALLFLSNLHGCCHPK